MTHPTRRRFAALALLPALAPLCGQAATPLVKAADEGPDNERWAAVRRSAFGGRPVIEDTRGAVTLSLPIRAADGAVVPVAIRTQPALLGGRTVRRLHLVVDRNPSPLGASFTFGPQSARAEVETRIRVEEYSHARAIAELDDGTLLMQTRFIKASGGCSAPAGADMAAAMASLGRIRMQVEAAAAGQPMALQVTVSHPNVSGLGIDQVSRLAPVPHYVRTLELSQAGRPVLSADVDFTISENPAFRVWLPAGATGELKAVVVDSQERRFEAAMTVTPGQRADG